MADIIFNPNPPAPAGLSEWEMSLLRSELAEDTLQTLLKYSKYQGDSAATALALSVADLQAQIDAIDVPEGSSFQYDIKVDFGAVGDGLTDDTAAFQAFFNQVNRIDGVQDGTTAYLFIPAGTYLIEEELEYVGDSGVSLYMVGEGGLSDNGTQLLWGGISGTHLIKFRGIQQSCIKNICFNGNYEVLPVHSCERYDAVEGIIPSYRVFFEGCSFIHPVAGGSADCFKMGKDAGPTNLQCSEYHFFYCKFGGNGAAPNRSGLYVAATSNTKNVTVIGCDFVDTDYGLYWPSYSGAIRFNDCTLANIGYNTDGAAVYAGGGDGIEIRNLRMENGNSGFRARICYGGPIVAISGGYFAGTLPADDYAIIIAQAGGSLSIDDLTWQNSRSGANVCKIRVDSGGVAVRNVKYAHNGTDLTCAPIYDGSNNLLTDADYPKSLAAENNVNIEVFGCTQGTFGGTLDDRVPNMVTKPPINLLGAVYTSGIDSGFTYELRQNSVVYTLPYTAFSAAASTKSLNLGFFQEGVKITGIRAKVVAFTGNTGGTTLDVGFETIDVDGLIDGVNVETTAIYGGEDVHLGQLINQAGAVQGGYLVPSGGAILKAAVTAGGSNLVMTTGSIRLTITYEFLG